MADRADVNGGADGADGTAGGDSEGGAKGSPSGGGEAGGEGGEAGDGGGEAGGGAGGGGGGADGGGGGDAEGGGGDAASSLASPAPTLTRARCNNAVGPNATPGSSIVASSSAHPANRANASSGNVSLPPPLGSTARPQSKQNEESFERRASQNAQRTMMLPRSTLPPRLTPVVAPRGGMNYDTGRGRTKPPPAPLRRRPA